MNEWISAAIAVAAGLVGGSIAGRIVRGQLAKASRPAPVQRFAAPAGSLVFTLVAVIGMVVALGFVDPDSLETLPDDLVAYLPRLLTGLVVVIIGNVVAGLAAGAIDQAMTRATGRSGPIPSVVKSLIMGLAGILAANQLGVDTTIITIAVAAIFFSAGLGAALMVGLGGREVAEEVAAARAMRRLIDAGDQIVTDDASGIVVAVHSTATELETLDGERLLIPNSSLLGSSFSVRRADSG